jgi:hypothetical protein
MTNLGLRGWRVEWAPLTPGRRGSCSRLVCSTAIRTAARSTFQLASSPFAVRMPAWTRRAVGTATCSCSISGLSASLGISGSCRRRVSRAGAGLHFTTRSVDTIYDDYVRPDERNDPAAASRGTFRCRRRPRAPAGTCHFSRMWAAASANFWRYARRATSSTSRLREGRSQDSFVDSGTLSVPSYSAANSCSVT